MLNFFAVLVFLPQLCSVRLFSDVFFLAVVRSLVDRSRKNLPGLVLGLFCPKRQRLFLPDGLDMQSADRKAGLSCAGLFKPARAGLLVPLSSCPPWCPQWFCCASVFSFLSSCSGLGGPRTFHQGPQSCPCWGTFWSWP